MPSERFIDALNAQVAREFAAAHQYTAIGTYYAGETFPRLAEFFYEQASEEREHAMKMVDYLLATESPVDFGGIDAPATRFEDHIAPIRLALDNERDVTVHISELFSIARETNDFRSEQFLHWFLEEQREEVSSMDALLRTVERASGSNILLVEEYLARNAGGDQGVSQAPPAAGGAL